MRKLGFVVTAIACLMMAAQAFAATAPAAGAFKGQMDIGVFGGVACAIRKRNRRLKPQLRLRNHAFAWLYVTQSKPVAQRT